MRVRTLPALLTVGVLAAMPAVGVAQAHPQYPERAVRRDIPMTDMIRRAFAAGTRDSSGRPGAHYWQLWTDYTIGARLDPATGVVTAHERVVVQNNSDSAMRVIVLRLDQNLFGPNGARASDAPEAIHPTDGMQLTALSVDGQSVNLNPPPRFRFGQPAAAPTLSAYNVRTTSATVTLPTPVSAHGSFTLEADWHFTVPKVEGGRGIRMGAWGDTLFQVAQWYPRVAVFDDLREGGWDGEEYLGSAEFYNNFGHFDVKLDLPAGWLVGASGVLQNPEEVLTPAVRERLSHQLESDSVLHIVTPDDFGPGKATQAGDRLVWHYVADTVGDFAWGTSDRYVWDATRATIPGRGAVPVDMLYLPGHAQQYAQAGPISRHALEFYSRLWMPYTFSRLTLVDGPDTGMEYPMIIFSAAGAADHEAGHEWWPMTLGTNETWYGWMDEGFNQYMNILSYVDRSHPAGNPLDGVGQSYGRVSGDEREPPMMWDANFGGPLYGFQAYSKAPMMLSALGGVVGDTAVQRAMSEYAHAWRFKHPSPWDYMFFMDGALKQDLGWFWYYWLFTTETVNGSITGVRTSGSTTTVSVRQDGQMPSPVVLAVHFAPAGPAIRPMANAMMVDDSTALVTWPADVWFAGSRTFEAKLQFGKRAIERIVLDPHCRFPDSDVDDNTWPRPAPAAPAAAAPQARFGMAACKG